MSATSIDQLDRRLLDNLPSLPGTAVEFIRLCEDPEAGMADVADVVRQDPALMARVLQVVNSATYSPRHPVTDIGRAAAVLGLRNMKMIGIGFAVVGELWGATTPSNELSGIIGASTLAASAARTFSDRLETGSSEEAATAGLLAYLGELAMLRADTAEFSALWQREGGLPGAAAQRDVFGVDGARVGVMLMEHWQIPTDVRGGARVRSAAIGARLANPPTVIDAALGIGTAIADLLATDEEPALQRVRPAVSAWGLDDDDVLAYWDDFRTAVGTTAHHLDLDVGPELERLIAEARDEYLASQVAALDQLETAHREIESLRAENQRLEGLSLKDPLTGVPNRAAFDAGLRTAVASLARQADEAPVAVVMFDLDHFKQVNDIEGHVVGDELLRTIAVAAATAARTDEVFARVGGDEFAMVMRPAGADSLQVGIERVRGAMVAAAARVGMGRATVSAGAAMIVGYDGELAAAQDELIRAADDALYVAKRKGRNQSFVAGTAPTAASPTAPPTAASAATPTLPRG